MNIHTMNNIDDLEISLLGFLSEKPMHGYELHQKVSDLKGFGIVWHLKIGKLYAMLNKLHENQLVDVENTQDGNRPVRNEYRLTDKGREILQQWIEGSVLHGRDIRHLFLMKLFFSLDEEREKTLRLIHNQQSECQSWQKRFESNLSSLKSDNDNSMSFQLLVNQYRLTQVKADLDWLSWIARKISEEK